MKEKIVAQQINFTKVAINSLPTPKHGRRTEYRDIKTRGLRLRIASSGVRTFCVLRRVGNGPMERITLGRYPDQTVEQARTQAAQINAIIANGGDPAATKRDKKAELTFAQLFDEYLERHAKPNKQTWEEDQQRYEQYLDDLFGKKKVSAIKRHLIALLHSQITRDGHATVANRVLALVSSVFGRAIEWGLADTNPAKGIRRNRERSRDRFLQSDEIPRFFAALAQEDNSTVRDYFLISLLTGARRSNVLAMRWAELYLERAEWRIPKTKNSDPQTIPLGDEVMELLKERKKGDAGDSPFVFPGTGESGHLEEPKKGWRRIIDRDELTQLCGLIKAAGQQFVRKDDETVTVALMRARKKVKQLKLQTAGMRMLDLRVHDLRRTLGSWQAKTGASAIIIGKSLNHKDQKTTAIYARLDLDPVRESVRRATSAILKAAGVGQTTGMLPTPSVPKADKRGSKLSRHAVKSARP